MKIKVKYEILDVEGIGKKTYTKTFSQVNDKAQADDFKNFAEAYLSLVNGNGHEISYQVIKTNEEIITSGQSI